MSISASAIGTYTRCQRLYAFTYVNGQWVNEAPGAPTTAGKGAHALLEDWFKHGTPVDPTVVQEGFAWQNKLKPDWMKFGNDSPGLEWRQIPFTFRIGQLAEKLLKECPPEPGYSEHKFSSFIEGIEFKGVVDLLTANYIVDFKTTSSDLKYAKTGRKLLSDPQRLIYSRAFPSVGKSRWITGEWRGLEIQIGERENGGQDREKFKLHVLEPACNMMKLEKGMDPLSLPLPGKIDYKTGMTDECLAFGKICSFAGACFPKKQRKLELPQLQATMAVMEAVDLLGMTPEQAATALTAEAEKLGMSTSVDKPESIRPITPPETPKALVEELAQARADYDSVSGMNSVAKGTMSKKFLVENLYIDCMPLSRLPEGEALEYSYDYVKAASDEVAGDMGVVHAMLVDFGKGPHLVCAQLIANLSDREEPIKHLFLETRSAEGRACMQELTARSRFVSKGCY